MKMRQQPDQAKISTKEHRDKHPNRSQFCKLVEACKRKDLATIRELLGAHPELLNHHDKHHRNLLHYTSILVHASDTKSQEPQDVQKGRTDESATCLDCFRYLLARCEPRLCTERDQDGLTVLHLAVISCNVGLVREILLKPTGPNDQLSALAAGLDKEHHGPLHWAVITNNLECVKILIEHSGVELAHQPDLNGATPLHYATQTSDYPKYRAQLRQMLKNATSSSRPANSSQSSSAGNSSTSSPLFSCDSADNRTKQQEKQTSEKRTTTTTTTTNKREPEVNSRSFDETGSCVTQAGSGAGNLDILRHLVQLPGVNLECCDRDLRTPLLWAASSGNRQAILLLLQSGADPLCQDANKLGPLHCAASHGYTDCLECFLSSGTAVVQSSQHAQQQQKHQAVNQPDALACTPLFYAVLSGNIDCVELLLDRGARHDWQDVKGRTGAHFAALKGQLNTLKLLESHGANLWLANKQGDLPLHYAIKSGRQQVIAWLLEHSPYERAVNAINNTGRAPIHLALLKGNPTMIEFLIRQGANLNQLVKVKDGSKSAARTDKNKDKPQASTSFRYETALDMAKRLNARDCLELLERNSAQSAAWVLAHREPRPASMSVADSTGETPDTGRARATKNRSLFDVQADEVGASPIGFETSGSSAEPPQSVSEGATRLPKLRSGPPPLVESAAPQLGDSTNSSALSQSSLTSVRGVRPAEEKQRDWRDGTRPEKSQKSPESRTQTSEKQRATAARRPYRGGINYHNERINASIKCKLYENGHHSSFPPLNENRKQRQQQPGRAQYHSAGSLAAAATTTTERASGSANQQEIITNVNVYTTSPHCPHCMDQELVHLGAGECQDCLGPRPRQVQTSETTASKTDGGRRHDAATVRARQHHEFSETSDTSDATSEILYDEDSDRSGEERAYMLPLALGQTAQKAAPSQLEQTQQQQQQQQARYLPPSQAYTQHLPVILSAEEERSTSGDTNNTGRQESAVSVSPGEDVDLRAARQLDHKQTQRARQVPQARLRQTDRYQHHDQVRSPVAEYIRGQGDHHHQRAVSMGPARATASDVRGWSQHDYQPRARAIDYSQVRAKVDSHRNDSGLSMSHFGDGGGDGMGSSAGRRSKSWSTLDSQHNPTALDATGDGGQHEPQQTSGGGYSPSPIDDADPDGPTRSCSRQTIIRTRRLSVDSAELASSVERSIRKYKQENKLFEELQNLKRSQIRSGRANEALLVKRLVERFRHEIQRDTLMGLDAYHGPYTYQAYELYLYDQLGKICQSNRAKLAGARAPHKFTYREPASTVPLGSGQPAASYEARDFFAEDLKAELELQRVIRRSEIALREQVQAQTDLIDNRADLAIEPSGALEDIRVRHQARESQGEEEVSTGGDQREGRQLDQVRDGQVLQLDVAPSEVDIHKDPQEEEGQKEEEVDEPTSPHAGRAFAGSSTASSRRSSVEVERDKLEKLPLRVVGTRQDDSEQIDLSSLATEKERRQIEAQALDLTAAIITDALGNVSRASSPVGQRRRADDDDENKQQAVESAVNLPAGETADQSAQEDSSESKQQREDTQRAAVIHGRRRSVVNIGNKMEIIYHNVGIEIDTVGENPTSDDDDDESSSPRAEKVNAQGESSGGQGEPRGQTGEPANQAVKLARVHEHEEAQEEEEDSRSDKEQESSDSHDANKETHADKDETIYEQTAQKEQADEHLAESIDQRVDDDDDEQQGESMAHTPSSSIVALESAAEFQDSSSSSRLSALNRPSATFLRRASSPPVPQGGGASKRVASRRLSVGSSHQQQQQPPPSTSDMVVVQRKVFNGFDLDSLHAHRKKHFAREQSLAAEGTQDSASEPSKQQSSAKLRTVKSPPAKLKQRLAKSRLPAGPYRVYVPTELIRARWLEVKRHERRRCANWLEQLGQDEIFEHSSCSVGQNQLVTSGPNTMSETISHAKSQPSLDGRVRAGSSRQLGREMGENHERESGECSNFTLIYELNKSANKQAVATQEEEAKRRAQIEQVNWCQRRITKIVDVRTLKRTLSLPECLIYSNDLLKRFSILKL